MLDAPTRASASDCRCRARVQRGGAACASQSIYLGCAVGLLYRPRIGPFDPMSSSWATVIARPTVCRSTPSEGRNTNHPGLGQNTSLYDCGSSPAPNAACTYLGPRLFCVLFYNNRKNGQHKCLFSVLVLERKVRTLNWYDA